MHRHSYVRCEVRRKQNRCTSAHKQTLLICPSRRSHVSYNVNVAIEIIHTHACDVSLPFKVGEDVSSCESLLRASSALAHEVLAHLARLHMKEKERHNLVLISQKKCVFCNRRSSVRGNEGHYDSHQMEKLSHESYRAVVRTCEISIFTSHALRKTLYV